MKILYLIHEFYPAHHGGSEKFILQIAQRVQAQGHQVKIVTFDNDNRRATPTASTPIRKRKPFRRILAAGLRRTGLLALWHKCLTLKSDPIECYEELVQGVSVIGFRSRRIAQNGFHLVDTNLTAFAQALLQREAPDVIHAGYLLRNAEFLYVAQQLRIPYVITLTTYWLICPKHLLINEKKQICGGPRGGAECKIACPSFDSKQIGARYAAMQQLLAKAGAIIAPSQHLARIFQREVSTLELTYIPYGMDCQRLPFNTRRYPTQQPLIFLFGGRLATEKGVNLLLTAFKRLPSRQVRLHIYGDGKFLEEVQEAAKVDSRIYYGGVYTNQQVGELLSQSDVVVIPSIWHENLPLIMQEAQACGVPTLVSDVGSMTECVTDGVNGFTFRMGDVADLQRKMQIMIDQPEVLNTIKENMRNPKAGQYRVTSLEEEASMYLEQYTRIVRKSP